MNERIVTTKRTARWLAGILLATAGPARAVAAEPSPLALEGFQLYAQQQETRLADQHREPTHFLVLSDAARDQIRRGELVVERLPAAASTETPGAMLHHWRGSAFAAGASAADFERLMRAVEAYPRVYAPEVVSARSATIGPDRMDAWMRVRQKHVLTVVLDTGYAIRFGHLDPRHGYTISQSTQIAEVEGSGTRGERLLSPQEDHGFLWRLNTYWSYGERDGGLYLQVETISLTRAIPHGMAWAIGPYVESIPRESLEFTLRSTCNALRR